jgi:hypothetical protein
MAMGYCSMKKIIAAALLVPSLHHSGVLASEPFSLEGTIFQHVATLHELDSLLLYSIAIAESAIGAGNGNIQPYPYVFRTKEGASYFKSRTEAQEALAVVLERTNKVDVGMMQINLYYHPQTDPFSLLDPAINLRVAAKYLKETIASTDDPVLGVGRYHIWADEERANWYGNHVWQIYSNLHSLIAFTQ